MQYYTIQIYGYSVDELDELYYKVLRVPINKNDVELLHHTQLLHKNEENLRLMQRYNDHQKLYRFQQRAMASHKQRSQNKKINVKSGVLCAMFIIFGVIMIYNLSVLLRSSTLQFDKVLFEYELSDIFNVNGVSLMCCGIFMGILLIKCIGDSYGCL